MTLPLTAKQERIWRYIKGCERSPTYEEMRRDLRTGYGCISEVITDLKERGFVTYKPGKARTLQALDPSELAAYPTEALEAELNRRKTGDNLSVNAEKEPPFMVEQTMNNAREMAA